MRRSTLLFDSANRPTPAFAAMLRDLQIAGDNIVSIDTVLQAMFFQQKGGKAVERWDLEKVSLTCDRNQLNRHLAACGFLLATVPSQQSYAYAAWPGALVTRAAVRLQDLIKAWNSGTRWTQTVVFGGKRPLNADKEDIVRCCTALGITVTEDAEAKAYVRLWDSIKPKTELDMMRFLWEAASLDEPYPGALSLPVTLRKPPVTFVDAPMKPATTPGGEPVRPDTLDTISTWCQTSPTPGTILVSSGAPYGMAHDEAFAWKLEDNDGFTTDTFGHAAPDLGDELFMREVAGTVNRIRKARGL